MSLEYDDLISYMEKQLPKKYKTGIVQLKYYERNFFNHELNFDPYKRGGQILPVKYIYRDSADPKIKYNVSKGEEYIPEMLYWMAYHKDYNCFPRFFVYTFFTDLAGYFSGKKVEQVATYANKSAAYLREQGYPNVNYRCKKILPIYTDEYMQIIEMVEDTILENVDILVKTIYDVYDILLKPYKLEYWCFQESEYKRANAVYKNAVIEFQNSLMESVQNWDINEQN